MLNESCPTQYVVTVDCSYQPRQATTGNEINDEDNKKRDRKVKIEYFIYTLILRWQKSSVSDCVGEASGHRPLTSAVPLLTHTGTLGCWVSPLAQSAPH